MYAALSQIFEPTFCLQYRISVSLQVICLNIHNLFYIGYILDFDSFYIYDLQKCICPNVPTVTDGYEIHMVLPDMLAIIKKRSDKPTLFHLKKLRKSIGL